RCRKLGEQLKPLIGDKTEEEDDSDKTPISQDELNEAYSLITEALEHSQFDNVNEIAESFKEYKIPDAEKERVKKIIKAAEDLDYDKLPDILK
ncbi:MAG: hypothetical protein IJU82_08185, partial [Ruminiclostridium sp.]|nr:hypothetical protein [Ruminiclostridium sp.]